MSNDGGFCAGGLLTEGRLEGVLQLSVGGEEPVSRDMAVSPAQHMPAERTAAVSAIHVPRFMFRLPLFCLHGL